jgi:predicted nucleic acid-binding protein
MLSARGAPAGILNLVVNGDIILVLDTRIYDEYADVLRREKFGFPATAVDEILVFIQREGLFVTPSPTSCTLPDPGDLPFAEAALHARVPVVTGNARHFRGSGADVMTPAEFLERHRQDDQL